MNRLIIFVFIYLLGISTPALAISLSVEVLGIKGAEKNNVLAHLKIEKDKNRTDLTPLRIRRLHAQAPQEIRQALQPYGYYKPLIQAQLIKQEVEWIARYTIEPGSPVTIASLDISVTEPARDEKSLQEYLNKIPIKIGDRLEHERYEEIKKTLLRFAIKNGYLDARYSQSNINIELKKNIAHIILELQAGPKYRFGKVIFHQDVYDEDFLLRYIKFQPGDTYDPAALLKLQSELSNSGLFERIDIEPRRDLTTNDEVPIYITLKESKPRKWKFGLGYGTDTGIRGNVRHSRRIGRRGHVLGFDLLASENIQSLLGTYIIPLEDPTTEEMAYTARVSNEKTDSRDSKIASLSGSYTTMQNAWRRVMSLNYEYEDYSVADQSGETLFLYPIVSWTRTRSDNRINPTHGQRYYLQLIGASDAVLSDATFLQGRANAKWVINLGSNNRFLGRTELGATMVENILDLPASKRFYAGGDNSIRGYSFEQLGPLNSQGEVEGGKYLLVASAEIDHRLNEAWSVAAFYDAGNAMNDFNNLSDQIAEGAGFGIRWHSPVGAIRVDFAWALTEPYKGFRLHLIIGPDL
jgi:translocation and assembly module TamA